MSSIQHLQWWLDIVNAVLVIAVGISFTFGMFAFFLNKEKDERQVRDKQASEERIAALNAQAELLRLEAEKARVDIASAQAEAAEANMKAEQERLERVKLAARVAPRLLDLEQKQAITASLKRFSGRQVTIVTYQYDAEAAVLADELIAALREAGISVEEKLSAFHIVEFFWWGIHVSGPANQQDFVEALSNSFKNDGQLAIHNGETKHAVPADITAFRDKTVFILVGVKPPVVKPRL